MSQQRQALLTGAGVAGVVGLVVLAAWAAVQGPARLFRGDGIEPVRNSLTATATSDAANGAQGSPPVDGGSGDWQWLRIIAVVIEVAALLALLYLLFLGLRGLWRWVRDHESQPAPEAADFEVVDSADALAEAIAAGAHDQRALLTGGTPRNGVVAAWHEFERAAERVGRPRKPSQTPSEFVIEILGIVAADGGAVARLADLYREARFSEHEITEAHRAAALTELDRIHLSLSHVGPGGVGLGGVAGRIRR